MTRITATSDELMHQAPATAEVYLDAAIRAVEKRFGKGTARDNEALLAAMVNASALDFGASVIARAIESVADAISNHE
jgi:hypothetical protein